MFKLLTKKNHKATTKEIEVCVTPSVTLHVYHTICHAHQPSATHTCVCRAHQHLAHVPPIKHVAHKKHRHTRSIGTQEASAHKKHRHTRSIGTQEAVSISISTTLDLLCVFLALHRVKLLCCLCLWWRASSLCICCPSLPEGMCIMCRPLVRHVIAQDMSHVIAQDMSHVIAQDMSHVCHRTRQHKTCLMYVSASCVITCR